MRGLFAFVVAFGCLIPLGRSDAAGAETDRLPNSSEARSGNFSAGAAAVCIDPEKFPVLQNGGFLQVESSEVLQSLFARSLVVGDGTERVAICVVDSCMLDRELCDQVKQIVTHRTGIAADHILISATHTHNAPSAMRLLGCAPDPDYPAFVIPRIAQSIEAAAAAMQPAEAGWAVADASGFTHCRRWIYLPHKIGQDPYGARSIRAMMHPGHANRDTAGPSGPIDPDFTVLAIRDRDGHPLAVLGNFSMHYFGGIDKKLSSDFTGRICSLLQDRLSAAKKTPLIAIMSQGTSGDLHFMNYGVSASDEPYRGKADGFDRYCRGLTEIALKAIGAIAYRSDLTVSMAETRLQLHRRLPDAARVAWAETVRKQIVKLPKDRAEVLALEVPWLLANPAAELKLQAIRIGELGITAMPNEVYGLTGLKIKLQSPLQPTMNIELANGADGYIPPPEQHHLGGYTTWPARTAGLEVQAEPQIVESVLSLLEQVSSRPRRSVDDGVGSHGRAILDLRPVAWWRMSLYSGDRVPCAAKVENFGRLEPGYALFLPGPDGDAFRSTERGNRAVHFAGGRMVAEKLQLAGDYTVSLWFWNAMPHDARGVTGTLFSVGRDSDSHGDHLAISGADHQTPGRLILTRGSGAKVSVCGHTPLELHRWYHVVLIRDGNRMTAFLDGQSVPELESTLSETPPAERRVFVGGRTDRAFSFEGKIDEVAVFDRALTSEEALKMLGHP